MVTLLKVMHIVYGGTGGAARIVLDIAESHDTARFEPVVVLTGYEVDPQYLLELKNNGIHGEAVLKNTKWDWKYLIKLRKTIAAHRPDIILLHTPVAYFWGRMAVLGLGVKMVISVEHLAAANYYGRLGRLVNLIQTRFISDKVICVSQDVKSVMQKELYLPDNKIRVIENGIPVNRYRQVNPDVLVLRKPIRVKMVSRLHRQKDPATLIKAIKLLAGQQIDIKLDFIGDGPLRPEMELLTSKEGLTERISFLGMCSDIPELLYDTDIFVLSTHSEGLPIALLEAMATGLPCIATAVPGILGIIDHRCSGLLVNENDAVNLAEAICSLIRDPGLARRLAATARGKVEEQYSISRTVKEYEEFFCETLVGKAHASVREET